MEIMDDKLYSFVIVDDEPEIREGIRDNIPWEKLGFRFAGACANGKDALELVDRTPPDVLMTDINMPFMDGLALCERLADAAPATKVLIISGYDDFEYARQALKLQVYDYIVKPVTPAEFKTVLIRLKETIDKDRAVVEDMELIKRRLAESLPELRERFLNNLITGKIRPEIIAERVSYFDLGLPCKRSVYLCLSLDFSYPRSGENFDIDIINGRNVLDRTLKETVNNIFFLDAEDRLTVILWGTDQDLLYREGLKTAENLRHSFIKNGMGATVIGVGEPVDSLGGLPQSHSDALRALKVALLRGKNGVTAYRELVGIIGAGRENRPSWGKSIASALKISDLEEARALISAMIESFKGPQFNIEVYHETLRLVVASILQCIEDLEIPGTEIIPSDADPFAELKSLLSLDDVGFYFTALSERIVAYTGMRQENFSRTKVREALEFLESRYSDPELSLQSICKELYISTSYFCAILKKYHNKTFVEQLTEVRMRRAMELLRTSALKTYEIAERAGYRDPHYFSLSFRKYSGTTPTEYRMKFRENDGNE